MLRGFARPNLALRARHVASERERDRQVDAQLAEALGGPGAGRGTAIVYAPTRRSTEEEAGRLAASGWRAAGYHAGMTGETRTRVQSGLLGRRARGRRGHERVRHGHRPVGRARGRPPRPAGLGRGVLPGGRARGARRARRPSASCCTRPATCRCAGASSRAAGAASRRGRRWSSTSGASSSTSCAGPRAAAAGTTRSCATSATRPRRSPAAAAATSAARSAASRWATKRRA